MRIVSNWFRSRHIHVSREFPQLWLREPRVTVGQMRACRSVVVAAIAMTLLPSSALGADWRIQKTVSPAGVTELGGVSCVSATSCMAVGGFNNPESIAEMWNGTKWSLTPSASPRDSQLLAVSCVSTTFCIAVGHSFSSIGVATSITEKWTGATWTALPTPIPHGPPNSTLSGVSCVSASYCVAVGEATELNGNLTSAIAESWNGTHWRLQTTPQFGTGPLPNEAGIAPALFAVSCVAANACTAVGQLVRTHQAQQIVSALVERWNGGRWVVQHTPNPSKFSYMTGVSCPLPSSCIAVGSSLASSTARPLAERWSGAGWTLATKGLSATHGDNNGFSGVSCLSATRCTAVGQRGVDVGTSTPVVEAWNGRHWTVQVTPRPAKDSSLTSISCVALVGCTAVGSSAAGTLAETDAASAPNAVS